MRVVVKFLASLSSLSDAVPMDAYGGYYFAITTLSKVPQVFEMRYISE